jgi:hypothetical protein
MTGDQACGTRWASIELRRCNQNRNEKKMNKADEMTKKLSKGATSNCI